MTSYEQALQRLPRPILEKLQFLIRKVRRLMLLRGLAATLAVGLGAIFAIIIIDASITIFSQATRWMLSLAALVVTLIAAWWFLVRPLSKKITMTHVARFLEIRHPELQERISTAVELISSDDPESIRGSEELIRAVVDSAVTDVDMVDPQKEFEPIRSNRFVRVAGILLAILLISLVIWPRQVSVLFSRAVAPFLDIGNAWAETISVTPGDIRVAKGSHLLISMTVEEERLRRADLRLRRPDGSEIAERMTAAGTDEEGRKKFSIELPRVEEDFSYRISAGAALTEFYEVTTVAPPRIEEIAVQYDYPSYTELEPMEGPLEQNEIRAVANTSISLLAKPNKPIKVSELAMEDGTSILPQSMNEKLLSWKFDLKSQMNGNWAIRLEDDDGFEDTATDFTIAVLPDRQPIVQIEAPTARELRLQPTELLPITYSVREDYGFSELVILVTPNGDQNPTALVEKLPERDPREIEAWQGSADLNLAKLDLTGHTHVTVQLRASDNLPQSLEGPNQGLSHTITILLDQSAKSLTQQTIEQQKKELEQAIRASRLELEKAKQETREVEQQLAKEDAINEKARNNLEEFHQRSETAQQTLREIGQKLENTVFNEQIEKLENVADEDVAEARQKADLIPLKDEKAERIAETRDARGDIEEAIRNLQEIERSINETAKEAQMLAELNDLANDQRELAQQAEMRERNPQTQSNKKEMAEWDREQSQVQRELGDFLEDNKAALAQVLQEQSEKAAELAAAAQELAAQQESNQELTEQATQAELQEALENALLAALEKEQTQIAADTKALAQETESASDASENPKDLTANQPLAQAAERTQQAASETAHASEESSSESIEAAAESAKQARDALKKATEKSDQEGADDTHSEIEGLAERQENVAEQLAAISQGDLEGVLAMREEQIRSETDRLQTASDSVEQAAASAKQEPARQQADQAERSLKQANTSATQAQQQLAKAQEAQTRAEAEGQAEGEPSRQTQQQLQQSQKGQKKATEALKQAADSLAQTSKMLAQQSEQAGQQAAEDPSVPGDSPFKGGEQLADTFQQVSEATDAPLSQQAQQSREAAESLQTLAQQAMEEMGMGPPGEGQQSQPGQEGDPSQMAQQGEASGDALNESDKKAADAFGDGIPPELEALGLTAAEWAQMKGALTSGTSVDGPEEVSPEYRELVGRYFRVIASEAGK